MDDTDDDARYPPNPSYSHPPNFHRTISSSHRPKLPVRNPSSAAPPLATTNFFNQNHEYEDEDPAAQGEDDEDDLDTDAEQEEEDHVVNRIKQVARIDEEDDDDEEEDDDDDEEGEAYPRADTDDEESESRRGRKRRRMEKLVLGYEFAPRVKASQEPVPAVAKPSVFGSGSSSRNSPPDWSEQATFTLLDAWGDRFLQLGRKSLRTDDWLEVAKRVSQVSKTVHTDSQCRNRLDTLKKKYKKEKMRLAETGDSTSKWVYFKKVEILMSSPPPRQPPGLACGLDSGEYVFMNPRVYINHSNGLDEMRDSPGNSESEEGDVGNDDESKGLPPSRARIGMEEENGGASSSYRLLADSIHKFGEIYQKIEVSKRQQMMELEKMRIDFQRELELQKRQILERAQAEIAKIRQGDDEEIDVSVENTSG